MRHAREHKIPYLGICLGMQVAVIEYARNVAGLEQAHSTEFRPGTPHPVIALITEWQDREGCVEQRSGDDDLGGTMRLGGQQARLAPDSLARRVYGAEVISERHRHRYEFNNAYMEAMVGKAGMVLSGIHRKGDHDLVEIIELKDHPWFCASQFHPEFKSTPLLPQPLFREFIAAALRHKAGT